MENNTTFYDYDSFEEDEYIFNNPRIQLVFFLMYSVVFFFSFFGNLAVVFVLSVHWKMRGSTKFCLGNLAFANWCVGAFCVYQDLSMYLIDNWIFGKFMCKMYHFINNLSHTASILILVVIALERYFAIKHPFKCRRMLTARRLKVIILLVWIVSGFICSPRLYYISLVRNNYSIPGKEDEPKKKEVICTLLSRIYDNTTSDLIQFILLFLLPLCISSIVYWKIGIILRQRETFVCSFDQALVTTVIEISSNDRVLTRVNARNSVCGLNRRVSFAHPIARTGGEQEEGYFEDCSHLENLEFDPCESSRSGNDYGEHRQNGERVALSREQRLTSQSSSVSIRHHTLRRNSSALALVQDSNKGVIRMLVAVLSTFALCNLPFHVRKLYQHFAPRTDNIWTDLATPLTFLLMYANCAINPILFAFMSRNFRSCFIDCVKCQVKRPTARVC